MDIYTWAMHYGMFLVYLGLGLLFFGIIVYGVMEYNK
jgi:hypothetical protein